MTKTQYHRRTHDRFRRRGSGYVLILGAAMLVSVIGLSSLTLVRVQWRGQNAASDAGQARFYARSGIECAIAYSIAQPNWRADYNSLKSYMPMPFGRGSISVDIRELDGTALNPNWFGPVLLTGTGLIGNATRPEAISRWSVQAHHPPLDCLRAALHAAGNISVSSASLDVVDGPLSTNATLSNTATIDGSVVARNVYNWGWISGDVKSNAAAKQMPSTRVWNYYRTHASLVTLPAASIGSTLEWVVLSPAANPWEAAKTSPDGLYYIKPSGDFRIRDCRIVGTLLVDLPAGKKLALENGLLWEPARPDFPSLIVNGTCEMRLNSTLYEAGRTNFNPAGTPYQSHSDYDRYDSYSCLLDGVFHVMGSTTLLENQTSVNGIVIAEGSVTIKDLVDLVADSNLLLSPPIMYRMSHLELDAGTWQPVVSAGSP